MIAKGKSISHGTAALEYDLAKEINGEAAATEIHRHELFGCTGEEMVQEMKPYFVDFPNVKNNCLRFEVSPSVEESAGMTDADWAKLGNDFMQRMGLMNHQYIIVKHSGTEKNRRQAHLHILANRVSLSGELYKDNWIGKRATEAAEDAQQRRLAAAGGTEQRDELIFVNIQADALEDDLPVLKALDDILELDQFFLFRHGSNILSLYR